MTAVIRVGVVGGAGRMGREVCQAVVEAQDLVLASVVDTAVVAAGRHDTAAGRHDTAAEAPTAEVGGVAISSRLEAFVDAGVDVAVDFTVADAARRTLPWLAEHGIHAVVGTTGLDDEDLAALGRAFTGAPANAVVAPNFAIGAVLLMRCAELAAPFMDGVEVVELHHDQKRDAPSGTRTT